MRISDEATARLVRGALAEHRKSQAEAAAVLGLSQVAVSRRLLGHVDFTVSELRRLADWLGVPVTSLVERATA